MRAVRLCHGLWIPFEYLCTNRVVSRPPTCSGTYSAEYSKLVTTTKSSALATRESAGWQGRASCSSWLVTGASSDLSKLAAAAASCDSCGRGSLAAADSDDSPSL